MLLHHRDLLLGFELSLEGVLLHLLCVVAKLLGLLLDLLPLVQALKEIAKPGLFGQLRLDLLTHLAMVSFTLDLHEAVFVC